MRSKNANNVNGGRIIFTIVNEKLKRGKMWKTAGGNF